ncbi:MAG: spiro-SPASM protein [Treponema sp.]|jgi:spiro-SPASM protein|nr:spiro-SPASM protein [Treponema sp.]
MNALAVLYAGSLAEAAYEKVFSGKNALDLSLERAALFPETRKIVLLVQAAYTPKPLPGEVQVIKASAWTKKQLLDTLASVSPGFDCTYVAWADCPLLDPLLTRAMVDRHLRYGAEYSYADGWPYGLSPEILAPGVAGILSKIMGDDDGPVTRDTLFSVLQKDINAFDIETEISPVDLRAYRLSLTADSRRNLLLLTRFIDAGFSGAPDAERIIAEKPELLRTLPNFYAIQVSGPCPQTCTLCPYPRFGGIQKDFMEPARFAGLLDNIAAFSDDAVIDCSLWGELSLHPEKLELIRMVLLRQGLSLIIETSGLGWKTGELEALAALAQETAQTLPRKNPMAPLSWIVSLDAHDPGRYRDIRGMGMSEALTTAKTLLNLFPKDAYVQAVRVKGFEDDIEHFYRSWKEAGANIIIQKYDAFCGLLPDLRASDLSPVQRRPCWHLMRDMTILIDGRVPHCKEDLAVLADMAVPLGATGILGNVFTESLETIWSRGEVLYREQSAQKYSGMCAECDEYYAYNF